MSRLIEKGLVRSRKQGKFVNYYVEGDVKEITAILRKYYPSIWTKLSNRLADLFLDISTASKIESNDRKKITIEKKDNHAIEDEEESDGEIK